MKNKDPQKIYTTEGAEIPLLTKIMKGNEMYAGYIKDGNVLGMIPASEFFKEFYRGPYFRIDA